MNPWRAFLQYSLCLSLAWPPGLAQAKVADGSALAPDIQVTLPILKRAQGLRTSGELMGQRLSGKLATYKDPAGKFAKYANEVIQFQALLIMSAAMAYQVNKEHEELLKLSNGAPIPGLEATNGKGACGATSTSIAAGTVCSGEFYLGMLGSAAALGTSSITQRIFSRLLGTAAGRSSLGRVLSAFASQWTAIAGATSATFLWSQAIKALPSADLINNAPGVAGRAALAAKRGEWTKFSASQDGQIFNGILANMYKIARNEKRLRDEWLYNTWRFGIARGEFVAAIASLMAAGTAGEVVGAIGLAGGAALTGAGAAAAGTAATLSAPVVGFILGSALGFGALTLLFDTAAPALMTSSIQGLRSVLSGGGIERDRTNFRILSYGFHESRYPRAQDGDYIAAYSPQYDGYLKNWVENRQNWANVAIELFYELAESKRAMEAKIAIAETAIKSANLQKNLYLDVDGHIVSYSEALIKTCGNWWISLVSGCDVGMKAQLKTIDDLKAQVGDANQTLIDMSDVVIAAYTDDVNLIETTVYDPHYLFPLPVAEKLGNFRGQSEALRRNFKELFACYSPEIGAHLQMQLDDKDLQAQCNTWSREELSIYYTHIFREDDVYESLRKAQGLE